MNYIIWYCVYSAAIFFSSLSGVSTFHEITLIALITLQFARAICT